MQAPDAEVAQVIEEARARGLFVYEAVSTLYLPNYLRIKEWLPRIGTVKIVTCNYSQYSSRYDAFCAGTVLPAFNRPCRAERSWTLACTTSTTSWACLARRNTWGMRPTWTAV